MAETSNKYRVRWWHVAAGLVVGLCAGLFRRTLPYGAFLAGKLATSDAMPDPIFSFPVDEQITIHVSDVLSRYKNTFSYMPPSLLLYEQVPKYLRKYLPDHWKPNSLLIIERELEFGEIYPVITVDFPENWLNEVSTSEVAERIQRKLDSGGIDALRINHGNGSQSPVAPLSVSMKAKIKHDFPLAVLETNTLQCIANEHAFHLEFVDTGISGQDKLRKSCYMHNPSYIRSIELPDPVSTPHTIIKKDLSLTLKDLVARTENLNKQDQYVLATGASKDPFRTMAVFEIFEQGTSSSLSTISDIKVKYTGTLIPYDAGGWEKTTVGSTEIITFNDDLSALDQPVMLEVWIDSKGAEDKVPIDPFQFTVLPAVHTVTARPVKTD